MKARQHKDKTNKDEIRSIAEFKRRFYPEPLEDDLPEFRDPEEVGEKLAKETLDRLQTALTAK